MYRESYTDAHKCQKEWAPRAYRHKGRAPEPSTTLPLSRNTLQYIVIFFTQQEVGKAYKQRNVTRVKKGDQMLTINPWERTLNSSGVETPGTFTVVDWS